MTQLLTIPIGTSGNLTVTEAAGVITVAAALALESNAVTINASVVGDASALLTALASTQTNTTLKMLLTEAAALAKIIP